MTKWEKWMRYDSEGYLRSDGLGLVLCIICKRILVTMTVSFFLLLGFFLSFFSFPYPILDPSVKESTFCFLFFTSGSMKPEESTAWTTTKKKARQERKGFTICWCWQHV